MAKSNFKRKLDTAECAPEDVAARVAIADEAEASIFGGVSMDLQTIVELSISKIDFDLDQPRKHIDPDILSSLAESIREHGLLNPIIVKRTVEGRYQLVCGERRYRACSLLERKSIAAIVVKGETDEIALIDNLQRVDLNAIETMLALKKLLLARGCSNAELARIAGRNPSYISNILGLDRLAQEIIDEYPFNLHVSEGHLIEISRMPSRDDQLLVWHQCKEGASQKEIRELRRELSDPAPTPDPPATGKADVESPAASRGRNMRSHNVARQFNDFIRTVTKGVSMFSENPPQITDHHRESLRSIRARIDKLLGEQ